MLDTATRIGEFRVVNMVGGAGSGTVINKQGVEGQIEGGIYMGLGYALKEDTINDEKTGEVLSIDFQAFKILGSLNMPKEGLLKILLIKISTHIFDKDPSSLVSKSMSGKSNKV